MRMYSETANQAPKLHGQSLPALPNRSSLSARHRTCRTGWYFHCETVLLLFSSIRSLLGCTSAARLNPQRAAPLIIMDRVLRSISQSMYALPSKYSLSLWQTPQRMCRFSGVSSPPTARARMWARSLPLMPHAKHVPRSMNSAFESYPLASHSLSAQCARMASSVGIFLGVVFNSFSVRLSAT